jgi:hypothetical protein
VGAADIGARWPTGNSQQVTLFEAETRSKEGLDVLDWRLGSRIRGQGLEAPLASGGLSFLLGSWYWQWHLVVGTPSTY